VARADTGLMVGKSLPCSFSMGVGVNIPPPGCLVRTWRLVADGGGSDSRFAFFESNNFRLYALSSGECPIGDFVN